MQSQNQQIIGATLGHYRIVSKLGEGGMGVVFEAEDLTLRRRVALKFCTGGRDDTLMRAYLLKEAQAASSLSHPNIAHIYEFVDNPVGDPFIAMELVPGRSLRQILAEGPLSVEETLKVCRGVGAALAEEHRHCIIHRDIKPGNIQITPAGEVRVLDFGIARRNVAPGPGAATMTLEGLAGTPLYMSPEQASGEPLDGRSDLFSLGVVLYECLTGKSPFAADSLAVTLSRVLTWQPPAPSRLNAHRPGRLDRVVLKLLAKNRQERYASANDLLADLSAPEPAISRRGLSAVLVGAAVCAGVGVPAWFWMRKRQHDPAAPAVPWYRDGIAALHYGSYYRASKALAHAVEIDPAYAMAHAYLAEAWYELDYVEKAKDELLKAMAPGAAPPEVESLHLDAIRQTVTGEFKAAADKFEQVLALEPAAERGGALLDLGRAQERNQDVKKAMATYAEATRLDPQSAAGWLRLGALHARAANHEDAGRELDRAENLFQAGSNVEGVTECLYIRARYRYARTPSEGRALIDKASDAAKVTGNEQQQIKLLLLSSSNYLDTGRTSDALEAAKRAIAIAHSAGIENLVSRGLIDLGNALFVKGQTAEALTTMQEALDIARRNREKRSEARALVNMGSIRIQTGNPSEGWKDVTTGLAYYRQGNFRTEAALALILLGRAARGKGDYAEARRAFLETQTTMQPSGASLPLALAQEGLASLEEFQDNWPRALAMFDEARKTFQSIGHAAGAATNLVNVALMEVLLGHKTDAAEPLKAAAANPVSALEILLVQERYGEARAKAEALLSSADASDRETLRGTNLVLGLALARSGAGVPGVQACRKSLDLAHESGELPAEAEAWLGLAEALLAAKDRAAAAGYASRARLFYERARKPEALWRACVLSLQSSAPDPAVASLAERALGDLRTLWPAHDFQSYLSRPFIRRVHAELLRIDPGAPAAA